MISHRSNFLLGGIPQSDVLICTQSCALFFLHADASSVKILNKYAPLKKVIQCILQQFFFLGGGDFKHCYTMHLLYFCYSLYLAALHFNENVARPQSRIKEGEQQYCVSNPKDRKGEIVAKKIKADQSFSKLNATCKYIVNFFSLS